MQETLERVAPTAPRVADEPRTDDQSASEMMWEAFDLAVGGLGVVLLPGFILALPGAILLLPLVLPLIVLGVVAALVAGPVLLARSILRRARGA